MVVQELCKFTVDKLFISAAGMELVHGLTDPDLLETEIKQAMIRSARQVILLADSSKWGIVHLVQIAPWSSIHMLISDQDLPDSAQAELEAMGIRVLTAS
jgi:DeoR/GlpR family transcriptional regulator of sugar metabolism